jgi:hypothetical protein
VDIDDTIRRTYGYAKQGAGYGYSKVKGLNALLGIVSTPLAAPVIAATRLRKGPSNSARRAAAFVAETIRTARACGASGLLVMRADSAFYGADVVNSCRALGARFSITVRMNASVKAATARIDEGTWTPIKYPKAVWDEEGECWISDAETAEVPYTAFTSKPKKQQVTARLIVRRVKRPGTGTVPAGQGTLFDTWRYHAAFTDSPLSLKDAERDHRRHAVVEQVIADAKNSAFAHAPSGHFQANAETMRRIADLYPGEARPTPATRSSSPTPPAPCPTPCAPWPPPTRPSPSSTCSPDTTTTLLAKSPALPTGCAACSPRSTPRWNGSWARASSTRPYSPSWSDTASRP